MAYVIDPNQQQQANAGVPGTAATQPITSAAPGSGPSGSKVPTGAPNQQTPAQPFTNLQAYLSANQPQIQQEANTVAGNLQNQYGQVQGDINAGTQAFNQQVAQGSTPENAGLVQEAAANPAQFVQTPGNTAAFQSQLNDQYTGPTNFEGTASYAPLNAEVTQGAANANLVNSPAGLQTYLQGSSPTETQGDTLLDTALIGANPQAIQQVQGAAAPFSQLPQYLSSQVSAADQAAQAAPGVAQKTAADAAAAMSPVISGFQNTLAGEVPAAQAQENAYNAIVNSNAATLNPINTALNSFNESTGLNTANPLSSYLAQQPDTTAATLPTIATPQQYSEDAALAQLMGAGYTPGLNQANVGQAGTFSVPTAQAANAPTLAQQIADAATNSEWGTIANSPVPGTGNTYQQVLNQFPAFPGGDANENESAELINLANAKPYEQLLQYLQSINPTGISPWKIGQFSQPGDYLVNS